MIEADLIADCIATRDTMLREIAAAKAIGETLATFADRAIDWRRFIETKRAEWEKQSAILDSIIRRLQAVEEQVRPESGSVM